MGTDSKGKERSRCGPQCALAHLCGLALLLELLQLLGSEEAHGLVASYKLGARWHGGEDDVAAQPTEAVDGKQDRALAPTRIRPCTEGNQGAWGL